MRLTALVLACLTLAACSSAPTGPILYEVRSPAMAETTAMENAEGMSTAIQ